MKVGIIGAGFVGSAAGYAMLLRGTSTEIVLVDADQNKAAAQAHDIADAAPVSHPARVTSGDVSALDGARVVVLTAGFNQQAGETRLELLGRNAGIFRDLVPRVVQAAPDAVLLVATNPVDVLTELTARIAGPAYANRVIGSGTVLDTARLRSALAARAGVDGQNVHAYVLGEHGDSEVIAWSRADIAGVKVDEFFAQRDLSWDDAERERVDDEVRRAAARIIAGKGATAYGVGAAIARITEAVLRDSRAVLTVSAPGARYGVSLSLPRVIGAGGVLATLDVPLEAAEADALERSARVLREAFATLT